jgi:hypothetical protein
MPMLVAVALVLGLVCNIQAEGNTPVPDGVKSVLDQMHPGWKLADISDENRQYCFKKDSRYEPTLIWGDFDGDGKRDFAGIIKYGKSTAVIVFLARGAGYRGFEVFATSRLGERPPELLDVFPKATQFGATPHKLAYESIAMEYCESSSVVYFYEAGTFHHVKIGD